MANVSPWKSPTRVVCFRTNVTGDNMVKGWLTFLNWVLYSYLCLPHVLSLSGQSGTVGTKLELFTSDYRQGVKKGIALLLC